MIRFSTIGGEEIYASDIQKSRYNKYKKTGKDKLYYIITNKKASIFNVPQNRLRYILITGVFEDPVAVNDLSVCPDDILNCDDITTSGFGADTSDIIDIYNLALKTLLHTMELPDDRTNNASSVIPQKEI
jgi:hypothetical protein